MPGPWSRIVTVPPSWRTSTTPPAGLHLQALSSTLASARSIWARCAVDQHRFLGEQVGLDVVRVEVGPVDGPFDELVEPERGRLVVLHGGVVAGELDEVADEHAELLHLGGDVAEDPLAFLGRHVGLAREHLDVRPHAGERRPQLVARVGDELALLLTRRGQRTEHRVEARGEATELVAPLDVDRRVEVLRLGDVLGGGGESFDGTQHGPGDDEAEEPGERDAAERHEDQRDPQRCERVVDLVERLGDLDRGARAGRDR